jgi:hypothetical protein
MPLVKVLQGSCNFRNLQCPWGKNRSHFTTGLEQPLNKWLTKPQLKQTFWTGGPRVWTLQSLQWLSLSDTDEHYHPAFQLPSMAYNESLNAAKLCSACWRWPARHGGSLISTDQTDVHFVFDGLSPWRWFWTPVKHLVFSCGFHGFMPA